MIKNMPTKSNEKINLFRNAIEHRATWFALMIEEAQKNGLDTSFAREAIRKCGCFHGENKFPRTNDLTVFAESFANDDVIDAFEMELKENNEEKLYIDFHYCPLVSAWLKLGLKEEEISELCDIAMDGDRGIISTYPDFEFNLGDTIAKGDDVCQIRINKKK